MTDLIDREEDLKLKELIIDTFIGLRAKSFVVYSDQLWSAACTQMLVKILLLAQSLVSPSYFGRTIIFHKFGFQMVGVR